MAGASGYFLNQFGQNCRQRINREMRSMNGSIWQATQRFNQVLTLNCSRFINRVTFRHLRETRSSSNRSHAATGTKANVFDSAAGNFYRQVHDVATRRVFYACLRVSLRELTCVSRILKMIENFCGVEHTLTTLAIMPEK